MKEIYFSLPTELLRIYDTTQSIAIMNEGVCYPFCIKLNKNSKKLVIFLPGAFNRETSNEVKFQRSTYFSEIEHNCIALFDPTLFLNNDISIGWFQGEDSKDYLVFLIGIISKIIEDLEIEKKNIIFFSTSAGGIPAFRLADNFEGSVVYAGNIQTDFLKYYKGAREKVVNFCYNNLSHDEILNKYPLRSNIFNIDSRFKVIYTQNVADKFHYDNHFKPYVVYAKTKKNIEFELFEYVDYTKGHSPLGKLTELKIIHSIVKSKSILSICEELGLKNVN